MQGGAERSSWCIAPCRCNVVSLCCWTAETPTCCCGAGKLGGSPGENGSVLEERNKNRTMDSLGTHSWCISVLTDIRDLGIRTSPWYISLVCNSSVYHIFRTHFLLNDGHGFQNMSGISNVWKVWLFALLRHHFGCFALPTFQVDWCRCALLTPRSVRDWVALCNVLTSQVNWKAPFCVASMLTTSPNCFLFQEIRGVDPSINFLMEGIRFIYVVYMIGQRGWTVRFLEGYFI